MLRARGITKVYKQGEETLQILKGIDLEVAEKDSISIVGSSGAGKSTLLHILGTLDKPTAGDVFFRDQNLFQLSDSELAKFRNENVGFVFQFHHLLGEFKAFDNVMMPGRLANWSYSDCRKRADELFALMGLSHRKNHYPSELSGGEQQRLAIARALFLRPGMVLADEPTGNLDSQNSLKIQQLFFDLMSELDITFIVVTHDTDFARQFRRQLTMADGSWV
jgi:lipoprotein-releasing system ATP-binding protein